VTFRYVLTENDALAFCAYHVDHSPSVQQQLVRARYLYPLVGLGVGLASWLLAGRLAELVAAAVFGSVWTLWWPGHWRRRYLRQAATLYREGHNASLFGEHRLDVESDEMVLRSPTGLVSSYPWASIERVIEQPGYLFVYVNALTAITVPGRGMLEGSFDVLLDLLDERVGG
jgi:YcxB-like protein